MKNKALYDFKREGSWNGSYLFHYECAWLCLYDYEDAIYKLDLAEAKVKEEAENIPPDLIDSYIHHYTDEHHTEAYRAATSAHLFVCMAIEGFINFYGVKRLGEAAYKRVLERIGITEKLTILYLLCFEESLDPNGEIIKPIRKVFDQRNALVHPKAKELNSENIGQFEYIHPFDLELKVAFEVLENFVNQMCKMDDQIDRGFLFKKPKKSIQPSANASVCDINW